MHYAAGMILPNKARAMRILLWGTYDLGKPRVRLMRDALRQIDPHLREMHRPVWDGIEDKSGLGGSGRLLGIAVRWLLAYPPLLWRFATARDVDVVVVGYLGLVDVLVLAPLAKLRGIPVVWDAFLSLYDTYARDRKMAAVDSWRSRLLHAAERLACRMADVVVLDTMAHAQLFQNLYGIDQSKLAAAFVGAEDDAFSTLPPAARAKSLPPLVLFYGQFIPLHGIDCIVEAALSDRGRAFRWRVIGQGQEAPRIDALLAGGQADHVERIAWVDYRDLRAAMAEADVCLGIFGTSDKAARVIPNKVFQALAAGKPLITRDSPAMRELATGDDAGLYLVPPGDAGALLDALELFVQEQSSLPQPMHAALVARFAPAALARQWHAVLAKVTPV
jgi:glycosyltransferase involved in cell wall biosynthesis